MSGEVDLTAAARLDSVVTVVIASGLTKLDFDLTGVTFIDLHGCRALAELRRRLDARNVEITQERWSNAVMRIHDLIANLDERAHVTRQRAERATAARPTRRFVGA